MPTDDRSIANSLICTRIMKYPVDVFKLGVTGILNEDLQHAAITALNLKRKDCSYHASQLNRQTGATHCCPTKLKSKLLLDSGSELRPTSHIHVVVPQGRLYGSSR